MSQSIKYIKSILDKYYLNDIDEDKAVEGAIEGYVASLGDPYTEYIPKDEMEEAMEQGYEELWELSEYFDVSEDMVKFAFWVYFDIIKER